MDICEDVKEREDIKQKSNKITHFSLILEILLEFSTYVIPDLAKQNLKSTLIRIIDQDPETNSFWSTFLSQVPQ